MAWRSLRDWRQDETSELAAEAKDIAALDAHPLVAGICALCGSTAGFQRTPLGPSEWREGLACLHCRCNARQRAAAMVLLDAIEAPAQARVYATEQASPLYVALRRHVPRLRGSEFAPRFLQCLRLSLWLCRHGVLDWIHREDATRLHFRDAGLDAVISLDVLEHVPDYRAALHEFARVLRPDGVLVLTMPFHPERADSAVIAHVRADGGIDHVGKPEYHGDPLSGGVLCFHHFGWDLVDAVRAAGFADACMQRVRDTARGLPQGQWVLRARR